MTRWVKHARLVATLLLLVMLAGHAPTAFGQEPTAKAKATKFELAIATGFATFPDLQVPLNDPRLSLRGDGAIAPNATAQHQGVAMQVYTGASHIWDDNLASRIGLGLLHGNSLVGEPSTGSASYLRYGLVGETEITDGRGRGYHPLLVLGFDWSRTKYVNVSESHFADTIVPFGRIGIRSGRMAVRGTIGMSVASDFGYEGGKHDSGLPLPNTSSNLVRYGADYNYIVNRSTSLSAGLEVETLDVQIRDVQRYEEFGLTVYPELNREQHYVLTTTVALLALNRSF